MKLTSILSLWPPFGGSRVDPVRHRIVAAGQSRAATTVAGGSRAKRFAVQGQSQAVETTPQGARVP